MTFKAFLAGAALLSLSTAAYADIIVTDAYARTSMPGAKTGAAFMVIENTGEMPDQLIDVRSDIAVKVELHTHQDQGGGVMKMVHVEEGFAIPAGGSHALARGGDHVMFMGLSAPMVQGETVPVTLVFEKAGEVQVEIPVDLERQDVPGMQQGMTHGMEHDMQGMKPKN
ncbi:copper chaperone PCu(A)C [Primorskyibacter sp. 2E107]|uniref:copper chaperone PCu(A)C n=1 Tax=Primorskyibacter sp. 2E107 TaxID=3403458 RepID=UPI003AF54CB1